MPSKRGRAGKIAGGDEGSSKRLNSLGLDPRQLEALLTELESRPSYSARRKFSRWQYRAPSVEMRLRHDNGAVQTLRVACRNLSCGGTSVLHNAFVHTGMQSVIGLPKRGGGVIDVRGTIRRCEHLQGVVHELGVQFDEPIRLSDFFAQEQHNKRLSYEQVDPQTLEGKLLLVSASEVQERTVRSFLAESRVSIRVSKSCADALEELDHSIDVVLADCVLPDGKASNLLTNLRAQGFSSPVIVAMPDGLPPLGNTDGVAPELQLRVPLDADDVLRGIAEFLLRPGTETVETAGAGAIDTCEVAQVFLEAAESLRRAVREKDAIGCYSVCMTVQAFAESSGRSQVASIASQAALALGASLDVNSAMERIDALIKACSAGSAAA